MYGKGIDSSKIFFDPLILPVCVEQSQALEALNTIQMIKESFEPKVNTIIGFVQYFKQFAKRIKTVNK